MKRVLRTTCSAEIRARDRQRMTERGADTTQASPRFMEKAELAQHRAAIVVDAFAGQPITGVERVDPTQWKLNAAAGCRQAAPGSKVPAADDNFNDQAV